MTQRQRIAKMRRGLSVARKEAVKRRQKYICARCHGQFRSTGLTIHHIKPLREMEYLDRDFNGEGNLVALCRTCHPLHEAELAKGERHGAL